MGHDPETVTRSSRSPNELRARLGAWLAVRLPGRNPAVTAVTVPEANGMSSETLLVDAEWDDDHGRTHHGLVARVEPAASDVPVFPTYDLARQFRAMQLVAERTDVPVPGVNWLEEDPDVVGGPFFVMERIDGRVPPDVMPYTMEGWVVDATPAQRRHLQDESVGALAGIHRIGAHEAVEAGLGNPGANDGLTPLQSHMAWWRDYYQWMRNGRRLALVEDAFGWLDDHWPADEGPASLSWGDARIGNMIFDGFTLVATLDWEMVGVAPAGVDVGWTIFLHTFFQDIAEQFELPGLPDMFHPDDVVTAYTTAGGADPGDLSFHIMYAAVRHALVMARVHDRRVHFGDAASVDDPDDAIMHRARLQHMLGQ